MSDLEKLKMKSVKMKTVFLLLAFLVATISCDNAFMNSGDVNRVDVPIEEFTELFINDVFEVYLYQDTICKLSIEGGDNLIPAVSYKVVDGKLSVSNENSARWSRDYDKIKLHVSVKKLLYLYLSESSLVQSVDTLITPQLEVFSITDYSDIFLNITCDNFFFVNSEVSGAYIQLKGSATNLGVWTRGSAIFKADEFVVENVTIESESIGDCSVHATKILSAKINNSGKIYYTGNPDTIIYVNDRAKEQLLKLE